MGTQMFRKILVPIDISDTAVAEIAVFLAAQFAALTDGAVRMIHVFPEIPYRFQAFLPPDISAERENAAGSQLQEMAKKANVPAGRFSHTTLTGVVYHEVLAEAEAWGADLIIVGSHSPSMGTYLLGSNAQKIVRHANCSVLVVRPQKDQHGNYWLIPQIAS
jgi:nucleotide-binding universal stress UspA family protein